MKNNTYKEVALDGKDYDCKNPLTRKYQYEYALYSVVSNLFSSVECRSLCIDTLNMYFMDLPRGSAKGEFDMEIRTGKAKNRISQEAMFSEMAYLVKRDVTGSINFPMMNICAAEVFTIPEDDGTHRFIFTDGIYGFSLHIDYFSKKEGGGVRRIVPKSLFPGNRPDKSTVIGAFMLDLLAS